MSSRSRRELSMKRTWHESDYVEVADSETLKPVEIAGPNSVLLLAVFFGKTRLIDNIRLG